MQRLSSLFRLIGALWVLMRHDALIPRELDPLLPPQAKPLAWFVHLFAGREAKQGRPGQRLALAFEQLGPVFIKLGQLLSTRADAFGIEFADDLGHLKDRLPPFPTEVARAVVEQQLGKPIAAMFTSFEPPVGAASLAQAHPATLLDGRKVAVKVLRPGIEQQVATDIGAMRLAASLAARGPAEARRLEPRAFVETIARSLELELDLRLEASAASEMGEVMAKDGYMSAPAVVWDGVAKRVLVLEWVEGEKLSLASTLEGPGYDRHALADNLVRGFLTRRSTTAFFMPTFTRGTCSSVLPTRSTPSISASWGGSDPMERRFLAEILWGFLRRDYQRVAQVHFDAGYVPKRHSVEAFAQALRAVGEPVAGRKATDVSMGRLLGLLFEITSIFDMHLRPNWFCCRRPWPRWRG